MEAAYVTALEELSVGDFDSTAPRAYNRSFAAKAERTEGDTKGAPAAGTGGGAGGRSMAAPRQHCLPAQAAASFTLLLRTSLTIHPPTILLPSPATHPQAR